MSTPGGYDPNAGSNGPGPYGGTPPPPPGAPSPYGGAPNPYGAPYAAAGPTAPYDGISIAALVTAVLCCTGPIAVVLGIIGVLRTKAGQRRGRWMSVTGIVLGTLATVVCGGAVAGLMWIGFNVAYEDDVEVGQCVNTNSLIGDENDLWRAECDEEHDAEIFAVVTLDGDTLAELRDTTTNEFCVNRAVGTPYEPLTSDGTHSVDWSSDAFSDSDLGRGDHLVCYLERGDGEQLTGPLIR